MNQITFTAAVLALTLGACLPPTIVHPIPSGLVATEGVTIQGVNDAFKLVAGARFTSPFKSRCWNWDPEDKMKYSPSQELVTGFKFARQHGAKDVRVKVPGRATPLYGVLMLCEAPEGGSGPASRTYLIEVPNQYVSAASDGKVSVVYERLDYKDDSAPNGASWYGWVLWLSDADMP
jgi:hypothetical protein